MTNDVLIRLAATIKSRRTARPEDSHTRRLLDGAPIKPAKKLGEEAVEVAIAALAQDKKALVAETADLLYHLLVVLESRRIPLRRRPRRARAAHERDGPRTKEAESRVALTRERCCMNPRPHVAFSPYAVYLREEWARLRADTPMPLTEAELDNLASLTERVSSNEVMDIYLPLSRLLNLYVEATQALHDRTTQFLRKRDGKMPFIIGLAGSVAVGKSTTARVLQALLARWPSHPRVELLPTDGFLFPNDVLEARGLMNRKGFPESYDLTKILNFLGDVKSGKEKVEAPVYSHLIYDVLPDQKLSIERPDIVIVEGLNVLQPAKLPKDGEAIPFVSDFFDFSIYIDAAAELVESWYVERFLRLRQTAFRDPASYFHRYATLSEEEAVATGLSIWRTINLVNLNENILPTRQRADLILRKGADHAVETVALRKL